MTLQRRNQKNGERAINDRERRTGLCAAGSDLLCVVAPFVCDGRRPDRVARVHVAVGRAEHQVRDLLWREPPQFGHDDEVDGAHGARRGRLVTRVRADAREHHLLYHVGARRLHTEQRSLLRRK